MTLFEAYENWVRWYPGDRQECCAGGHFMYGGGKRWNPKSDDKVCERELAWRKVVRIRDSDLRWPFILKVEE
jgi:hypothetical protein